MNVYNSGLVFSYWISVSVSFQSLFLHDHGSSAHRIISALFAAKGALPLTSPPAVARFAEPLAYTSVNPYLPDMIRGFGIAENDIATWAGLTSAAFSLAQSITAVPWGRAADRYGRKPVLVVGLLSTMTCFIVWGLSTSLPMAITVRAIQGGGNGNGTLSFYTHYRERERERETQSKLGFTNTL